MIPTIEIKIFKVAGRDLYGQPTLSLVRATKAAPVLLKFGTQNSTVRTDSAASQGHATESDIRCVLLVSKTERVEPEWIVEVMGRRVKVREVHPRHRVTGPLDHYQLDCVAWA